MLYLINALALCVLDLGFRTEHLTTYVHRHTTIVEHEVITMVHIISDTISKSYYCLDVSIR